MVSAITFCSCDTPETMAYNHYYYAKSLFEEGKLERALEYAESAADDNNSTAAGFSKSFYVTTHCWRADYGSVSSCSNYGDI